MADFWTSGGNWTLTLFCPNNCDDKIICAEVEEQLKKLTDKDLLEKYEELLNDDPFYPITPSQYAENPIEKEYKKQCWFRNGGERCSGEINSSRDRKDGAYGYFCPVCGHSLRDHPEYGEQARKDRGARTIVRVKSR